MPTGYTAGIKPEGGYSFEAFVMGCARAFGACITLRDDPSGGDCIPEEFVADPHHADRLAEVRNSLRELEGLTDDDCTAKANAEFLAKDAEAIAAKKARSAQRDAYQSMLDRVRAWNPPTPEHVGLKAFMVDQIVESIGFDCRDWAAGENKRLTGRQWRQREEERLLKLCARHSEEHAKEVERAAQRTAWVRALRESLKSAGGAS